MDADKVPVRRDLPKLPANHGQGWTHPERQLLFNAYTNGIDIYRICAMHERTYMSIWKQLLIMDLVDGEDYDGTHNQNNTNF